MKNIVLYITTLDNLKNNILYNKELIKIYNYCKDNNYKLCILCNTYIDLFNKKNSKERNKRLIELNFNTNEVIDLILNDEIDITFYCNTDIIDKFGTTTPYYNLFNDMYMVYMFFEENNNYDYYWVIEDDVYFNNKSYNIFFDFYKENNSDLLCLHYLTKEEKGHHTVILVNFFAKKNICTKENYAMAFMPVARLSNKLLTTIINYDEYKFNVYQEHQVGMICKKFNYKVEVLKDFIHYYKPYTVNCIKYNSVCCFLIKNYNDSNKGKNKKYYIKRQNTFKDLLTKPNIFIHPIKSVDTDIIDRIINN